MTTQGSTISVLVGMILRSRDKRREGHVSKIGTREWHLACFKMGTGAYEQIADKTFTSSEQAVNSAVRWTDRGTRPRSYKRRTP